ncbi:pseudouridine synthase [Microvirga sp. STR05]|uniref:Pseudouridine synthase n=1 Tax=Hymenobacter duratus TaxID=2771356 RepID=A0ABR8JBX1_9BACT|nr:pseudouridine synthase [Hymenobacter duratus]MBD2714128.1 pseudouridine synthase [Hymenobacter duratus]MBR7949030.1 pseudouridine synthase [Microvirga sp. STR05]
MPHRHFLLFKPFGYLSQFVSEDAREARKKKFLGVLHDFPEGTMSVGRLDEHSEGLLLLTTDGRVSERVRRKDVEKEYYAQVDGLITDEAVALLQQGVEIGVPEGRYRTLPCAAFRLPAPPDLPPRPRKIRDDRHGPTSWVSITVTEGKYRQVRKMTAAAGFPTLRLVRVRIGHIRLGGLQPGEVREVPELLPPDSLAATFTATEPE